MAEHETIADIIAEMRGMGNYQRYSGDHARVLADRLEAAHKRERAKIEADALEVGGIVEAAHRRELSKNASKNEADFGQLGDAAKLREALEAITSGYENADLCDTNYREWCHNPENVCVNVLLCKAIHEARAALSTPPRNCDLPEIAKDPWRAWLDDRSNWDEFGSPNLEIHDWLLATATEKEGGAK